LPDRVASKEKKRRKRRNKQILGEGRGKREKKPTLIL